MASTITWKPLPKALKKSVNDSFFNKVLDGVSATVLKTTLVLCFF